MTPLRVRVVRGGALPGEVIAIWSALQGSAPGLDGPYFCPGYLQAVAAVRADVEVAVLEDGNGPVGLLPFQRRPGDVAGPVGGRYSDFQGVVAPATLRWDPPELLRACRLRAFHFDHLLADQQPFRPYHWTQASSPYVDLSAGFEAYRADRRRAGSREIDNVLYKRRKVERRLGAVRFELHTSEAAVLEALLRWKAVKLEATGQPNDLVKPWVRGLLERIRATREEDFAGMLSALWIGDRLAAVHLGMRSRTVLHYWLPAYDRALAPYSPGQILFLELARAAAELGIRRIDLGKGDEPYKARLMSGAIAVAEGAVDLRPVTGALREGWHHAVQWCRRSPLRAPLRGPVRWLRRRARSRPDE